MPESTKTPSRPPRRVAEARAPIVRIEGTTVAAAALDEAVAEPARVVEHLPREGRDRPFPEAGAVKDPDLDRPADRLRARRQAPAATGASAA